MKIRHYLKDIRAIKGLFEDHTSDIELRIRESSTSYLNPYALQRFLEWYRHISAMRDLPLHPEPKDLLPFVRWAREARQHYLEFLKGAYSTRTQQLPRWVRILFKLGRYSVASRVLVQLASEFPALFNPMRVESVVAPATTRFTITGQELPLTCVLRRVVDGASADEQLPRLARIWNTAEPEAHFREACSLTLKVHAEMQLLGFYDHNPNCKPSFRFIGVSKKSCYLCHMFLTTHPDSFATSSCHQKLYVSWMPPLATSVKVYKKYKVLATELTKIMEATAKEDLKSRLGSPRRPIPADSTAGVSLSGLTSSDLAGAISQVPAGSCRKSTGSRNSTEAAVDEVDEENANLEPVLFPIEVVSPTEESWFYNNETPPITAMVFHFTRADDATRQDIVSIGDILEPFTDYPSWPKLVKILEVDDGVGVGFKEGRDFLMIDARIRVMNERQFFACLQYLHNLKIFSLDAFVCST